MNPHIELVKKWLADDKSVSLEELKANKETADAAYWDAKAAYWHAKAAYWAGDAAYWAAYWDAADAEAAYWRSEAIKHVKKYEELNK